MHARLTDKAVREMETKFKLEGEALRIFKLVVAEWKSDPMSVQCFDLRIVEQAKEIDRQLQKISPFY